MVQSCPKKSEAKSMFIKSESKFPLVWYYLILMSKKILNFSSWLNFEWNNHDPDSHDHAWLH